MDKFKVFQLDGRECFKDTAFIPAIRTFPGGEQWVKLPPLPRDIDHVRIEAILTSSADVMTLIMLVDAVRRVGIRNIRLTMPYVPYARQDRVCNPGESLSIAAFANIINSLEFSSVVVYDPHSDVAPALIDRCLIKPRYSLMTEHDGVRNLLLQDDVWLVSPDAGAVKKTYDTVKELGAFKGIIFAEKVRDVTTGNITKTTVSVPCDDTGKSLIDGAHLLVADDICDGGRTFIELAKVLLPYAPASLNLYVTHGIFSAGLEALTPYYNNVWSTVNFHDYK